MPNVCGKLREKNHSAMISCCGLRRLLLNAPKYPVQTLFAMVTKKTKSFIFLDKLLPRQRRKKFCRKSTVKFSAVSSIREHC